MTFSTNVPNANQSPGLFPAQMNTDLDRLKLLISGNHQFNDTVAAPNSDGFHNRVDYIIPAAIPTIPTAAGATGYAYNVNLGTQRTETFSLTPLGPMLTSGARAFVVFEGRQDAMAVCTILSGHNVDSVVWQSTGTYLVTFSLSLAMPTANYAVFASVPSQGSAISNSIIPGDTTATTCKLIIRNTTTSVVGALNNFAGSKISAMFYGG